MPKRGIAGLSPYETLVQRLTSLDSSVTLDILTEIAGYPIYLASLNTTYDYPIIWLNAGTHGDEPATVETAMRILEQPHRCDGIRVLVTPCLNGQGYDAGQRENAQDVDINWAFRRDDIPEIMLVKEMIERGPYAAIIDLHEDWESPGYYLYEQVRARGSLGGRITDRVRSVCPVNDSPVIEGEKADRGVIHPNMAVARRNNGDGVPGEVFRRATDHQITAESPTGQSMEARVNAHLTAIDILVETYRA